MKMSVSRDRSLLGADLRVNGDITSDGEVYVLGVLTGTLRARNLTLGKGGTIEGTVEAESVVINGNLSGSLSGGSVWLGATARVSADITYVSMKLETGAVCDGRVRHVGTFEASAAKEEPPIRPIRLVQPQSQIR